MVVGSGPVLSLLRVVCGRLLLMGSGASAGVLLAMARGARLTHLLRTVVELIANTVVVLASINDLLKSIIVTVHLYRVCNYGLNAIIMSHDLYGANDPINWHVVTPRNF